MKPLVRWGAGRLVLAGETDRCPWRKVIGELLLSSSAKSAAESLSRRLAILSVPKAFHNWVDEILGVRSERSAAPVPTFLHGAVGVTES